MNSHENVKGYSAHSIAARLSEIILEEKQPKKDNGAISRGEEAEYKAFTARMGKTASFVTNTHQKSQKIEYRGKRLDYVFTSNLASKTHTARISPRQSTLPNDLNVSLRPGEDKNGLKISESLLDLNKLNNDFMKLKKKIQDAKDAQEDVLNQKNTEEEPNNPEKHPKKNSEKLAKKSKKHPSKETPKLFTSTEQLIQSKYERSDLQSDLSVMEIGQISESVINWHKLEIPPNGYESQPSRLKGIRREHFVESQPKFPIKKFEELRKNIGISHLLDGSEGVSGGLGSCEGVSGGRKSVSMAQSLILEDNFLEKVDLLEQKELEATEPSKESQRGKATPKGVLEQPQELNIALKTGKSYQNRKKQILGKKMMLRTRPLTGGCDKFFRSQKAMALAKSSLRDQDSSKNLSFFKKKKKAEMKKPGFGEHLRVTSRHLEDLGETRKQIRDDKNASYGQKKKNRISDQKRFFRRI